MTSIRIFGRCIKVERRRFGRHSFTYSRGGRATPWPWWQIQLPLIELTVSRVKPSPHADGKAAR